MRLGILGGTFDPVHNGHLALAAAARDHFSLDTVLFVPAGQPWRKTREITPAAHRLAMLELAVAGNASLGISDVELRRPGPTYTADTLDALAGERLDDAFWFILGADALADLPHWKDPERIVRHAVIAVAPRTGLHIADEIARAVTAIPLLAGRIAPFPMVPWDHSSTEVRERSARVESLADLVPPPVEQYIKQNRLYT